MKNSDCPSSHGTHRHCSKAWAPSSDPPLTELHEASLSQRCGLSSFAIFFEKSFYLNTTRTPNTMCTLDEMKWRVGGSLPIPAFFFFLLWSELRTRGHSHFQIYLGPRTTKLATRSSSTVLWPQIACNLSRNIPPISRQLLHKPCTPIGAQVLLTN